MSAKFVVKIIFLAMASASVVPVTYDYTTDHETEEETRFINNFTKWFVMIDANRPKRTIDDIDIEKAMAKLIVTPETAKPTEVVTLTTVPERMFPNNQRKSSRIQLISPSDVTTVSSITASDEFAPTVSYADPLGYYH